MIVIQARDLTRVFGRASKATRAVDCASFEVPQGTVFGLLGPNGAGKSTLLKLLVGHLRPTSGSAEILGQPVGPNAPALWQRMGYVPQARYLPAWMTAAECLRFARALRPRWDEAKVSRLIARFEVPLDVKIHNLSRGNYVRLLIVLALAHNPELIVLDEPTSGLDPVARHELLTLLVEEIGEHGHTIVLSSHLVEDIERMADSVAILERGRIVASGTVDALKGTASLEEAFLAAVNRRAE
jgi:ABC-2 type transport system ATP-binding protein